MYFYFLYCPVVIAYNCRNTVKAASNSYLMSVVTVIVGMPLPIINLITTLVFLFANKRRGYFVRWHCMQALMSQALLFFMNMAGVI